MQQYKNNRYVIDIEQENQFHAGSKAREDINQILQNNGYSKIAIKIFESSKQNIFIKIRRNFSIFFQVLFKMLKLQKKGVIIFQYPFLKTSIIRLMNKICKIKKITFIAVVHDIESIRYKKDDHIINDELNRFSEFDYLIVHNRIMKNIVLKKNTSLEGKIIELYLFDYLVNSQPKEIINYSKNNVIIAGNLSYEKSPYVYQLENIKLQNTRINLYGINYNGLQNSYIQYKGVFKPDNIPFNTGFGLVWDGDSIDTCSGDTGEYTRINNPHKLSLYMAAGIPVFVWKEAAIAHFVKENNLGFCIESLNEIDDIIDNLTDEQYRELVKNVNLISKRVQKGYYTLSALEKIYDYIGN